LQHPKRGDVRTRILSKKSAGPVVLVEPVSYRFQEITQGHGTTLKALIHEMFGDGSRSASDFEMEVQKEEDPRETLSSS